MKNYTKELIEIIKKEHPSKENLSKIKIKLCKKLNIKKIPTDISILLNTQEKDLPKIKKYLISKPTRTISGVSVIAVMSKPYSCPHGRCTICPGGPNSEFGNVPQSYTGKEPATRRAIRNQYDPYLQVMNRLEQYMVQGHVPEKIELIVMGGTFPSLPKLYRNNFIKFCFKAMNDFSDLFYKDHEFNITKFKKFFELPSEVGELKKEKRIRNKLLKQKNKTTLELEKKRNEKSNIRCVGLTLETRPDYAKLKDANEMLRLGCTRVELGIQTIYDSTLRKIERGHSVKDSIESTQILKDLGFKINYHMMPGLPGVSYQKDLASLKELFKNQNFQPDMLKLYPCMVLKGTKLYQDWKKGNFIPITTKKAAKLIYEFKKTVPEYVRIMRVQRDIPTFITESGVDKTNLRQYIEKEMKHVGVKCSCIRCREIGRTDQVISNYKIKIMDYKASFGTEFFIEAVKNNALIGFCRLRFPSSNLRKEIIKDSALIRELHVYGKAAAIGKKGKVQHKGIGKELLKRAEDISKKNNKSKIIIISGIGVRDYYRKLGYKKQGPYMVKKI